MIELAMLAAKFVPSIIGMVAGDNAEEKAEKVVDIARTITGIDEPESAMEALSRNPQTAILFQQAVMSYQLELAREDTKRIQAVNQTMQAEAKSEHWAQWLWRPFNGFMFGITLFWNYVINETPADIPQFVLMAWAAVLGVTAWHRGKEKIAAAGGLGGIKGLVSRTLG